MKFKGTARRSKNKDTGDAGVAKLKARAKTKKSKLLKKINLPKKPEFVLTIGDEGAILVQLKQGGLAGRWFAADPSEENLEIFSKAIANSPAAPLTIVFDTMDQLYSQQTLPPVSKMSLSGLLKRRATREFGRGVELKGNYFLSRSESKEWEYMMYALEVSERTKPWLDWAARQPSPPKGIRVLPLEAAVTMQAIVEAKSTDPKNVKPWQYLVSYNKASGVRQVILRDGKMVFTRLGQPLEGDASTEAGAIEQEVVSTVEYLKRIGLKSTTDLRLCVVGARDVMDVIDVERMGVKSNLLLSPYEAAQLLGIEGAVQEEDRYGDVFLAAFVASYKKSSHVLWTKALNKMRQLYMGVPALRIVGALAVTGLLGHAAYSAYLYWSHSNELSAQDQKRQGLDNRVIDLQKKANMPKEELEAILQTHDVYKSIKNTQTSPADFLVNVSWAMSALPRHMRVQSLTWQKAEGEGSAPAATKNAQTPAPTGTPAPVSGSLNINILVPENIKLEALEKRVNEVVGKFTPYLPHYKIELSEVPQAQSVGDSVNIDFSKQGPEEKELKRVTLMTTFTGTDYIPDPVYGGAL